MRRNGQAGELALAMIRLPWALGFWTLQQIGGLANPARPLAHTVRDLEDLRQAASRPLEGPLGDLHRAGDRLQAGLVDSAGSLTGGRGRDHPGPLENAWQTLSRTWDQTSTDPRRKKP